ncbi:MAG: hypothetical protein MJZ23_08490 [Paludibacteraceae bacterium]|nr:hypothetical protein [Paludibacteraceae bacterium]
MENIPHANSAKSKTDGHVLRLPTAATTLLRQCPNDNSRDMPNHVPTV